MNEMNEMKFDCAWDYLDFNFYLNLIDPCKNYCVNDIEKVYAEYVKLRHEAAKIGCEDFRGFLEMKKILPIVLELSPNANPQNAVDVSFDCKLEGFENLLCTFDYDITFVDEYIIKIDYEPFGDHELEIEITAQQQVFSSDNYLHLGEILVNEIASTLLGFKL